ncbi:sodium:proton antiporter [Lysinibacillus alkalisoli]|uniref:Sodium:proton antiporter n=1 Tax=Lysinibacillus alkalisoli TaxID=1911548 RepID=A0A917LJ22_9BACI|nr:Na+/H+ antiporter NhaC family protein [Lysinibacillus alkalisoli]GGG29194.1 sodium:proton antiporter [Lysinibacillus alkalisoli]
MNAVIIAVAVMLILSLLRVNVVLSLVIGAFAGGLVSELTLQEITVAFTEGLGGGAVIALSYAMLGGFAVAISKTGITDVLILKVSQLLSNKEDSKKTGLIKALIFFSIFLMAIFSQNLIPIHIAFIPLLIPPILQILNLLQVDRRIIAIIIAVGLVGTYSFIPFGFGFIFQDIITQQINNAGMVAALKDVPKAMLIPIVGMVLGMFVAMFIYRKPRTYDTSDNADNVAIAKVSPWLMVATILSLVAALVAQIMTESMILGAMVGILAMYITGALKWREADHILTDGMRMMSFIGFVMIAAAGFANVIKETGHVDGLVESALAIVDGNVGLAVFGMLIVGLIVTMGIGSSFATIPIIATLFVPMSLALGLSPLAIICLIGTAGALGDAGSPASDTTLGPTSGLNVDGQHNHIWDTCVPTFIFINIPLIVFGWLAVTFIL